MTFDLIPLPTLVEITVYFVALLMLIPILGPYMAKVLEGQPTFLSPVLAPIEKGIYWSCGINPAQPMGWKDYANSVLLFCLLSFVLLVCILMLQGYPEMPFDLALNAAASFITNTNWQPNTPETTVTLSSQMLGFSVQNFISAAVGLSVMAAFTRGLAHSRTESLGNFWADVTRTILYILLPLSALLALILISQGVVQTFGSLTMFSGLDSATSHTLTTGPVASQIAIKQLGTNGGGYFAANAAHPFENPTPLTNFIQMLAILLLPASAPLCYGKMIGHTKQGATLLIAMFAIFIPLMLLCVMAEHAPPFFDEMGISTALGNMEGKELRFAESSGLWASLTTAASNGATNASLDSFMPLAGLIPLLLIQFGEIIFGGIGSGLYGMVICVLLTVFVASLMIGRTPEYLGKKVGVFEIKMASLVILIPALTTLLGTGLAVMTTQGTVGATNPAAQGFSEILYALSSASNNNGSAFAGLQANTPFYNILLGACMLVGRFGLILSVLALAGSMGQKTSIPMSQGTLSTTSGLFILMLIAIIILLGALTYVPALMLGPIAEHLHLFGAG